MPITSRFQSYIGFVTPPNAFDCSLQHLLGVLSEPKVGVCQHLIHAPEFVYTGLESSGTVAAQQRLASLETGVSALVGAQADIVAQVGAYWALPLHADEAAARELQNQLSHRYKTRVILVWNALVDALREINAKKICVATGYFRQEWTEATISYLATAGFEILWAGDAVSQGIISDHVDKEAIEQATHWDYLDCMVKDVCIDAAKRAPAADAVVQTGVGMRPGLQAASIESKTGIPLVATDNALNWAVLKASEIAAEPGHGQLLDMTRK